MIVITLSILTVVGFLLVAYITDMIIQIKELNKEQKLDILNQILQEYPDGYEWLCIAIPNIAYDRGFISEKQYMYYSATDISKTLIPELKQFEPIDNPIKWFETNADRIEAVKKMIEQILKSLN